MRVKLTDNTADLVMREAKRLDIPPTKLVNRWLTELLSARCSICNRSIPPYILMLQSNASHPMVCSIACLAQLDFTLLDFKILPEEGEKFVTLHGSYGYWQSLTANHKCTSCGQNILHSRSHVQTAHVQTTRRGYGSGAVIVKLTSDTRLSYYCIKCCFPADSDKTSSFYMSLPATESTPLPHLVG